MTSSQPITIARVDATFEREPFIQPMGFKGGFVTEGWQTASLLESGSGRRGIGLSGQGVLWSDATVFAGHSESGGNALMYAVTDWALQRLKGVSFTDPVALLESIRHDVHAAAKRITGHSGLRETFSLNALVGVDFAAWMLYAAEYRIHSFDDLIPEVYRPALAARHSRLASIPLMSYSVPIDGIRAAVDEGFFFMKIKIGQPGTQAEMLEKDMARLSAIHAAIGHARTPHTADGRLPYYFDANGRYESKEALLRLFDHARKIGAIDQIAVVEEPFPEELEIDVGDLPVRIAADESAHTDSDAARRIEMGYRAIALKPIAKTLSMSLRIAKLAHEKGVPCFCADLTVSPLLVEWNKNVAARLPAFPGLGLGLLETNGHQNYRFWDRMRTYHPAPDAPWAKTVGGVFELDADYYARSGGVFEPAPHYEGLFVRPT